MPFEGGDVVVEKGGVEATSWALGEGIDDRLDRVPEAFLNPPNPMDMTGPRFYMWTS